LDCAGDPGSPVTSLIRETFELQSVVLFDGVSGTFYQCGDRAQEAEQRTRNAYLLDSDAFVAEEKSWFCVLRLGVRPVGALALCGTEIKPLTATALASLCAMALERARALEKQNHAEAARQAEQLRTAVLDALAHKFKTPLTVIRTASSGLPAAGELSGLQTELVSLIDQEAKNLNALASRLLGAPNLDSAEFAPQPEPLLLSRLMKAAIQELEQQADRDRFQVSGQAQEPPVFADRELILTALAQLVDNALKYSFPASPIEVRLRVKETAVILAVRSKGLVVASADRERIFERFYRAPGAQRCAAGTGLGLSIVKTIATDHQGHVWAEGEADYGTTFSFSLPIVGASR
jgi:two-component system sensor histidine kinase KdpD